MKNSKIEDICNNKLNKFNKLKKFNSSRLKNDELFVITGGNTVSSAGVCYADGDCDELMFK